MSQSEIDLLRHELLLRGVYMDIPPSAYNMAYDKALSVCLYGYIRQFYPMPSNGLF